MLPNHSPLVIAEQFGTLESLYPGRIDLGLGRAPGTDMMTAMALRRNLNGSEEDFPSSVMELMEYLGLPKPETQVRATPGEGLKIPIWLLGSSTFSAQLAAMLGLPFAFASHFAPAYLDKSIEIYRNKFKPSETLKEPYVIAAVNVVAADNDKEANRLFTSIQLRALGMLKGSQMPLQPPVNNIDSVWSIPEKQAVDQRLKYSFVGGPATVKRNLESSIPEKHAVDQRLKYSFVGGPATVKRNLESFVKQTQADEIMAVSHMYEHPARLRSYEILSSL